jgi:uncharacterized protein
MFIEQISENRILIATLLGWWLAQFLKPFFGYVKTRRWSFGLWFATGGMPSSHSALMTGACVTIGLYEGFNTAVFVLALAITMIVVYDSTGVRRQAGLHAEKINLLINEIFSGQPITQDQLQEVLGHRPIEVAGGIILGLIVSITFWNVIG